MYCPTVCGDAPVRSRLFRGYIRASHIRNTLYKIFAAEFIGRDKGGPVVSTTKIAQQIFKAWKNDPISSVFPAFRCVKEWRDLAQWNKDNFLFMAKWYLSRQKNVDAAKTSHNKRIKSTSSMRKKTHGSRLRDRWLQ